jgi:hypothetical protein
LYRNADKVCKAKLSPANDVGEDQEFRVFLQLANAVLISEDVCIKEMQ